MINCLLFFPYQARSLNLSSYFNKNKSKLVGLFTTHSNISLKVNIRNTTSCHTKVSAFTEGSINVFFELNEIIEVIGSYPNDSEILADMKDSLKTSGIGNFVINETSLMTSK